jgi:hypothetical protein
MDERQRELGNLFKRSVVSPERNSTSPTSSLKNAGAICPDAEADCVTSVQLLGGKLASPMLHGRSKIPQYQKTLHAGSDVQATAQSSKSKFPLPPASEGPKAVPGVMRPGTARKDTFPPPNPWVDNCTTDPSRPDTVTSGIDCTGIV